MMYREINAVCSKIHTKQIKTLCGQNGEILNVKLLLYSNHLVIKGKISFTKTNYLML